MASEYEITWWSHQMETFSALLAFGAGNSPLTGEFPSQRPVTRSLIYALSNGWVLNQYAGDLRRHRAHYGVTVMTGSMIHWQDKREMLKSFTSVNHNPIDRLVRERRNCSALAVNLGLSCPKQISHRWVSARKTKLQCVSNEVTSFLH